MAAMQNLEKFDANESEDYWDPLKNSKGFLVVDGQSVKIEVLGPMKSGKEATAYVCRMEGPTGQHFVVAKYYRDMATRGFRNDAIYQQGRWSGGTREGRAFANRSKFGLALQAGSWVGYEYMTLARLHAAGLDVPRPMGCGARHVLMEYLGDEAAPAPMLQRVRLNEGEARPALDRILLNVRRLLALNLVHGDLSPYNILWWQGRPMLIDFPQAVDPRNNPAAFDLLSRDLDRVCRYFAKFGVVESGPLLAMAMREDYTYARLRA